MKIVRIEAIPVNFPLKKPMLMGGRPYASVQAVIVRLVTSGRHAGWGEASIAPFLTGESLGGALSAIRQLEAALVDLDVKKSALPATIERAVEANPSAKAAVEVALKDALAREMGMPLHRMLSPTAPPAFPCVCLVGNSSRERDLAEALEKAREGFRCFKLKVANGNTAEGCLNAARVCLSHGGSVNLSGKLGESSIANAATLALAGAIQPLSWALSLTNHYLAQDIVKRPITITNGRATLLNGPGLGIEVDEAKLARLEIIA